MMSRLLATLSLIVFLSTCQVHGDPEACSAETRPKVLTDPTGIFVSLNFPGNYIDSLDCQWLIVAQPDQVVNIDFTAFDTERAYDLVYFFDGDSMLSPVIAGLDGAYSQPPSGIISSQRNVYVRFTSDESVVARGFRATYQSVDPAGLENACSVLTRPLLLTAPSGEFTSRFFPDYYPLQCECQWLIVAESESGHIQVDFTVFATQANNDWVVLYDGNSQSGQIIARLSGVYTPPPTGLHSTQRYLFVRFASDTVTNARGFSATYTSL
jgi:hypothetical protein